MKWKLSNIPALCLGMVLLWPAAVLAKPNYQCWAPKDIRHEAADAAAVFTGTVQRVMVKGSDTGKLADTRFTVLFRVNQAWKGFEDATANRDILVETVARYRYDFKPGEDYLVLAYGGQHDRMQLPGCPRTQLLEEQARNIRRLGKPVVDWDAPEVEYATPAPAVLTGGAVASPAPAPNLAAPTPVDPAIAAEVGPPLPPQAVDKTEPTPAEKAAEIPTNLEQPAPEVKPEIKPEAKPEIKPELAPAPIQPVKKEVENWDNTAPVEPTFDAPAPTAKPAEKTDEKPAEKPVEKPASSGNLPPMPALPGQ